MKPFLPTASWFQTRQEYQPDLLVGDLNYPCSKAASTFMLGGVPRVLVSNLPILDPLVPGRLEAMPNPLSYNPQMISGLGTRMGALGRLQNVGAVGYAPMDLQSVLNWFLQT